MKSNLSQEIDIPSNPKLSLESQMSALRKRGLTSDEIKDRVQELWEKNFKKIDKFWNDLPNIVESFHQEKIEYLDQWETGLFDREALILDREERLDHAEVDEFTKDVFTRLYELLENGVSPDLAAELLIKILEHRKR